MYLIFVRIETEPNTQPSKCVIKLWKHTRILNKLTHSLTHIYAYSWANIHTRQRRQQRHSPLNSEWSQFFAHSFAILIVNIPTITSKCEKKNLFHHNSVSALRMGSIIFIMKCIFSTWTDYFLMQILYMMFDSYQDLKSFYLYIQEKPQHKFVC